MVDTRLTYRKRHPYNTRSNGVRKVKTPGGKLVFQTLKKKGSCVRCGDCGKAVPGIPRLRPFEFRRISKRQKSVSRAYGGNRCAGCVRQRIVRAFLIEEQKIVKRVLKAQQSKPKDK